MSFLKTITKSSLLPQSDAKEPLIPSEYRGGQLMQQFTDKSFEKVWRYEDSQSPIQAYRKCPPLSAVLNKMAQGYVNGKTWVMDLNNKEAKGPVAEKIRKLLKRPNPIQSWKQFEAQQQIYLDLYGFTLVLAISPLGFEKYGAQEASALWNIPPFMIEPEETNKLFYQTDLKGILSRIKLTYKGVSSWLPLDHCFIFKDFIPNADSMIFPGSRLKSLEMPINNIIGAYESRNVLINYRGALGVFTQEPGKGQFINVPITDDQKTDLQNQFKRYGLKNGQWKFIITEASVRWQQIGIPTGQLMLFEEIEDDIMRICDEYGFPSPLLNSERGPSVSNTKEYKAMMYQDAVIPKAEMCYEQWNEVFKTEDSNLQITKDYEHLAVLQQDEQTKWAARKVQGDALINEYKNDIITMNRLLELMGEDTIGPEGDKKYSETDAAKNAAAAAAGGGMFGGGNGNGAAKPKPKPAAQNNSKDDY